jgi:DNA-binding CsgD family transcriptional regulator
LEDTAETLPTQSTIWQEVAPDDDARQDVERLMRRSGYRIIDRGILPADATLGIVRSAVSLTSREREVLEALLLHDHNREIANALGISTRTVEDHIRIKMQQFGVASRHRLLARALLSGLLTASESASTENHPDSQEETSPRRRT